MALDQTAAPAAERARHAEAGGLNTRAAELYSAAGDQAMQVFAMRNATVHYERALSLGAGDLRLLEKLGRAYEFVNEWERARDSGSCWLVRSLSMTPPPKPSRSIAWQP